MKALVLKEANHFEIEEIPVPDYGANEQAAAGNHGPRGFWCH